MGKVVRRSTSNVGDATSYFLSTGNLISPTGLDLQQTSGFVVVAEKINFYVRMPLLPTHGNLFYFVNIC
jgi:DNA-directed RNA polymerase I subunit RPA2